MLFKSLKSAHASLSYTDFWNRFYFKSLPRIQLQGNVTNFRPFMLSNTDSLMSTSLLHLASTRCAIHRWAPSLTLSTALLVTQSRFCRISWREKFMWELLQLTFRELRNHVSRVVRLVRHNRDCVNQRVVESTREGLSQSEGAQRCIAQGGSQVKGRGGL